MPGGKNKQTCLRCRLELPLQICCQVGRTACRHCLSVATTRNSRCSILSLRPAAITKMADALLVQYVAWQCAGGGPTRRAGLEPNPGRACLHVVEATLKKHLYTTGRYVVSSDSAAGVLAAFLFWLVHPLLYKPDPAYTATVWVSVAGT